MIASPTAVTTHADPLAAAESEAEVTLGEDGQEHEAAREDGLDDRQRRQRERADVKPPGAERHDPADREPPRAKEPGRALQRVPDLDLGGARTAPRCLSRKETLVATAQARARASPTITPTTDP